MSMVSLHSERPADFARACVLVMCAAICLARGVKVSLRVRTLGCSYHSTRRVVYVFHRLPARKLFQYKETESVKVDDVQHGRNRQCVGPATLNAMCARSLCLHSPTTLQCGASAWRVAKKRFCGSCGGPRLPCARVIDETPSTLKSQVELRNCGPGILCPTTGRSSAVLDVDDVVVFQEAVPASLLAGTWGGLHFGYKG